MRTHYFTATSIDGYIADEHDSLGWLFQFPDDTTDDTTDDTVDGAANEGRYPAFVAGIGAVVMGSTTYAWLLREEIRDDPGRWPYEQPTWVFTSRELPGVPGADVRFVSGPVAPVHAEIARLVPEGQDLWVVGGGDLVGQFLDAGLLDEVHLTLAPVFLGGGAPLLPRRLVTPPLELVSCTRAGPFVELDYRVQRAGQDAVTSEN